MIAHVRILIAAGLLLCLIPLLTAMAVSFLAVSGGCAPVDGGPDPCLASERGLGETLQGMGALGWLYLAAVPIGAGLVILWGVIELGRYLRSRGIGTG